MVFDNTGFSDGEEGFMITTKNFYHKKGKERIQIPIHEINSLEYQGKDWYVNGHKLDLLFANGKDRKIIGELIVFSLNCMVYCRGSESLEGDYLIEDSSVAVSSDDGVEVDSKVVSGGLSLGEDSGNETNKKIGDAVGANEIASFISSIGNDGMMVLQIIFSVMNITKV